MEESVCAPAAEERQQRWMMNDDEMFITWSKHSTPTTLICTPWTTQQSKLNHEQHQVNPPEKQGQKQFKGNTKNDNAMPRASETHHCNHHIWWCLWRSLIGIPEGCFQTLKTRKSKRQGNQGTRPTTHSCKPSQTRPDKQWTVLKLVVKRTGPKYQNI